MAKHLCWSLLGIAELEPLDSVDSPSVTLAQFLFGAFLVMGVILLINMMIALLSNTYQRVQVTDLIYFSVFNSGVEILCQGIKFKSMCTVVSLLNAGSTPSILNHTPPAFIQGTGVYLKLNLYVIDFHR